MATTAAIAEFRRVYANPQAAAGTDANDERRAAYPLLWSYYENNAFEEAGKWAAYRSRYRLYKAIRPIYNPTRRLVDFYAGIVYQGAWTVDPAHMTEPHTAIPFAEGTDRQLLGAIGQVFAWSNCASIFTARSNGMCSKQRCNTASARLWSTSSTTLNSSAITKW